MNFPTTLVHSVPKSGTHLLGNIISNLPCAPKIDEEHCWINIDNYRELDQRRNEILFTHLPRLSEIEKTINESGVKHIFISRDPRDLVVSLYYYILNVDHDNGLYPYLKALKNKSEQINAIITGVKLSAEDQKKYNSTESLNFSKEFSPIYSWRNAENLLIIQYEELMNEKTKDKILYQILEYYEPYLKHKKDEMILEKLRNSVTEKLWIFRKGTTGQWKSEFNLENKTIFKSVAGELLIELGYEKDMDW